MVNPESPPDFLKTADSQGLRVECEGGEKALFLLDKSQKKNLI
jgi:hypothetical protein